VTTPAVRSPGAGDRPGLAIDPATDAPDPAPETADSGTGTPTPGARRSPADRWLPLLLSLVAGIVHAAGAFRFPALADDEGTYAAQALAVRSGELAHYTYWYDHPPAGWIQLAALDWLPQALFPGTHPVAASRAVMVLAWVVSGALIYLLARRLGMHPAWAFAAGLLTTVSPLTVTLGRQVYLDTIAVPWVLATFLLIANRRQHLWMYAAAGLSFGVAVLTKETTLVLLPAVVWALVQHTHARTRAVAAAGFGGAFALTGGGFLLMAVLRGELFPGAGHVSVVDGVLFQLVSRPGSGSILEAGSPSRIILEGWLFFDSWIILLGLAALPVALVVRRLRPVGAGLLLIVLVACKPNGYLPAMYVIVALPLLGLVAAGAADAVWGWVLRRRPTVRMPGIAVLSAAVAAVVVLAAPAWAAALDGARTSSANDDREAAEAWLAQRLRPGDVVLVDDVSWVGLVQNGASAREDTIWFYKLDTDPEIETAFPGGWRDVDYVLSTDQLRLAVTNDPSLRQSAGALAHSQVIASFGSGPGAVDVHLVEPQRGGGRP
jgi:4-amino-4-deoxy-L-arabinose transferase-like glycosyltransferase